MGTMRNLFRVISAEDLRRSKVSGLVPRCPSDDRSDCIHLNFRENVEAVAAAYFSPEENPVALEIRRVDIAGQLTLGDAVASKPWTQHLLHQPNILFSTVIAVHHLEVVQTGSGPEFSSGPAPDSPFGPKPLRGTGLIQASGRLCRSMQAGPTLRSSCTRRLA